MHHSTPPRLIIDDSQTIVVLDTNPARNLAQLDACPPWVDVFAKMRSDGYSFSLAEEAFTELVIQRARGSIRTDQFKRMCERLSLFINTEFPVILGGIDLLGMLQINRSSWTEESCRNISAIAWAFLQQCIEHPPESDEAEALINAARDEWINRLTNWQAVVDSAKSKGQEILQTASDLAPKDLCSLMASEESIMEYLSANPENPHQALESWVEENYSWESIEPKIREVVLTSFDEAFDRSLPETVGMHLEVRYHWQQFSRMQREKRRYDPRNKRNINDGVDYYLYGYLKLPALLITEDNDFFSRLMEIESYQKNWIYKPDGLAENWMKQTKPMPSFEQRSSIRPV
ncbi:hypothetical protein HU749_004970 [Pseudomonas ogarae]|uniref:hypothetical protein n=1 Tax=Pseudomonas ogarae (strain DSM 112162 / CECT 30235 / F113) TaxID=1114970 RepID=UPI0016468B97|nr:hypothetical protein [Pseudomonas zarinae]QXH95742.1 hypothetical protein HU749_004970 [Pseudomonas zarinae]